jgi:hypothetical protein
MLHKNRVNKIDFLGVTVGNFQDLGEYKRNLGSNKAFLDVMLRVKRIAGPII